MDLDALREKIKIKRVKLEEAEDKEWIAPNHYVNENLDSFASEIFKIMTTEMELKSLLKYQRAFQHHVRHHLSSFLRDDNIDKLAEKLRALDTKKNLEISVRYAGIVAVEAENHQDSARVEDIINVRFKFIDNDAKIYNDNQ